MTGTDVIRRLTYEETVSLLRCMRYDITIESARRVVETAMDDYAREIPAAPYGSLTVYCDRATDFFFVRVADTGDNLRHLTMHEAGTCHCTGAAS